MTAKLTHIVFIHDSTKFMFFTVKLIFKSTVNLANTLKANNSFLSGVEKYKPEVLLSLEVISQVIFSPSVFNYRFYTSQHVFSDVVPCGFLSLRKVLWAGANRVCLEREAGKDRKSSPSFSCHSNSPTSTSALRVQNKTYANEEAKITSAIN